MNNLYYDTWNKDRKGISACVIPSDKLFEDRYGPNYRSIVPAVYKERQQDQEAENLQRAEEARKSRKEIEELKEGKKASSVHLTKMDSHDFDEELVMNLSNKLEEAYESDDNVLVNVRIYDDEIMVTTVEETPEAPETPKTSFVAYMNSALIKRPINLRIPAWLKTRGKKHKHESKLNKPESP